MKPAPQTPVLGKLVVDANVLVGALLRDSTNRNLILHGQLDLHAPEWLWDEFERNRSLLLKKSRATGASLDLLIERLQDQVRSIPMATIEQHVQTALKRVGDANEYDAPYVAAAIAIEGGVWTHDKTLGELAGVPCFTTGQILAALDEQ